MTKTFTTLQLFSIVDGRLSTNIDDVYDMLNHIMNDNLMTHHLPTALKYLKLKSPAWFQKEIERLEMIRAKLVTNEFHSLVGAITTTFNEEVDIPQLKDVADTSDYIDFMMENSLLLKKFS